MSRTGGSLARNRRLAGMVRPYRLGAVASIVSLLVGVGASLAGPALGREAIDKGIYGNGHLVHDRRALALWVGAFVLAALVGWAALTVQTYATSWVGRKVLSDLRIELFTHIQRLELGYFERERAGRIISRLTNDVDALEDLVTDGVTTTLRNTLLLIGTAVALVLLDWRLALATLVVFPPMAAATIVFRVRSSRANRVMRERLADVTATLAEDLAGVRVIKEFDRNERSSAEFESTSRIYRLANGRTVWLNAWYFPFVELLSVFGIGIVLTYGGYLTFEGAVGVGTLFAFVIYLQNFFDPVQQLSLVYNTYLAATAALNRIFDVLDTEPELRDAPGALALARIDGRVELDNVRFGYGGGPDVLHGLTLTAEPGTTVALVGHTGAGKSTIVKLLARFYDPRSGAVRIDGHDVRHVQAATLRRQLGIVPAGELPVRRHDRREHRLRAARGDARRRRGRGRARSAPTASSRRCPRPTTRRSPSAATRSRPASASSSRSPARSSPTRASSCSTRPPRASTSRPSARSASRSRRCSRAAPRSSSPTGSRRSAAPTRSSCSRTVASSSRARTSELLAQRGRYAALYEDWAREPAA